MDDELNELNFDFDEPSQDDLEPQEVIIDDNDNNLNDGSKDDSPQDGVNNDTPPSDKPEEDDLLTSFLKSKGIKDPSAIKQLDDEGNIQEVNFNSLSKEEQLNILKSSELDNNYGLENEETEFINLLRDNNLSVSDYLDYVRNQAIEQFVAENSEPQYTVDSLSDEELYLTDLKYNIKDLQEEEAMQFMEHAKANEDFWKKKIETLRESYKKKEAEQLEEERQINDAEEQQKNLEYTKSIESAIGNLDSIESFDLEDSDRERISEFVLGTDATGTNYLMRALQDPENLAKVGWFLLDGADSIKALNNYWKGVVNQHSKNKYQEGYNDAISGSKSKINTKTSTPTNKSTKNNQPKFISLDNDTPYLDLD